MRKIILMLALAAQGLFAAVVTDTFAGTNGTNLSAHTANTGNSWTSFAGTLVLDGNGYIYGTTNNGYGTYKASGTFASGSLLTLTFLVKPITNTADDVGAGVVDASNNHYVLVFNVGGTIDVQRQDGSNGAGTILASTTGVSYTLNVDYTCTLTVQTNGTTVTMTALVKQGVTTIWSSGTITDTTYPNVNQVMVKAFTTAADTQTTGWHVGNLNAVVAGMTASPSYIAVSTSGNVVALTGASTAWVNGTTTFSLSGGTGASITAQSVSSATAASITVTAGSLTGALTISNNTDSGTTTVTVVIPVSDSHWFFAPYCTQSNGSGTPNANNTTSGATLVVWNNPGCYLKTDFVGTLASLVTIQNGITSGKVAWSVDNGAVQTASLSGSSATIALGSGLANTTHTLWFEFTGLATTPDRWTGSPVPTQAMGIGGLVVASGGSLATASGEVAVLAKNCLFYGDSIYEGYSVDGSLAMNASESMTYNISRAFGCEYGNIGFSGQGWLQGVAGANLPGFTTSWSLYQSGVTRLFGGKLAPIPDYVWTNHGNNDASVDIVSAVEGWLTSARTAIGTNAPIFVTVPIGRVEATNLTTAVNAQRATDPYVYLIDLGSIFGLGSRWSVDNVHPNVQGHAWIGAMYEQASQAKLSTGAGSFPIGQ